MAAGVVTGPFGRKLIGIWFTLSSRYLGNRRGLRVASGHYRGSIILAGTLRKKMRRVRNGGPESQGFGIVWIHLIYRLLFIIILIIFPSIRIGVIHTHVPRRRRHAS